MSDQLLVPFKYHSKEIQCDEIQCVRGLSYSRISKEYTKILLEIIDIKSKISLDLLNFRISVLFTIIFSWNLKIRAKFKLENEQDVYHFVIPEVYGNDHLEDLAIIFNFDNEKKYPENVYEINKLRNILNVWLVSSIILSTIVFFYFTSYSLLIKLILNIELIIVLNYPLVFLYQYWKKKYNLAFSEALLLLQSLSPEVDEKIVMEEKDTNLKKLTNIIKYTWITLTMIFLVLLLFVYLLI